MPAPNTAEPMRIAKAIAHAGLCSRRDAERMIESGRVAVNGKVLTTPAHVVAATDKIVVDGKALPQPEAPRLWRYNKPRGLVTSHKDPQGRKTVFEALPESLPHVVSVGRLDINTEGLLLLTTDGALARHLELPSTGWLRRYRVRAYGQITQARLDGLRNGIVVDGIRYGAIEATLDREQGDNCWITFAMREGKNREIRNVLGELGLKVNRLIRLSYGPFQLAELPAGAVEEVKTRMIREQLGERLAAIAGADFSGPMAGSEIETAPQTKAPPRPIEVRDEDDWVVGHRPGRTSLPKVQAQPRPASESKDQRESRPASAPRDRAPKDRNRPRPPFAPKDRGRVNPAAAGRRPDKPAQRNFKDRGRGDPTKASAAPDRPGRGSFKGRGTLGLPNKKDHDGPSFEGRRQRSRQDDGTKKHAPDNRHRGPPPRLDGEKKSPRPAHGKHRGHRGDRGRKRRR